MNWSVVNLHKNLKMFQSRTPLTSHTPLNRLLTMRIVTWTRTQSHMHHPLNTRASTLFIFNLHTYNALSKNLLHSQPNSKKKWVNTWSIWMKLSNMKTLVPTLGQSTVDIVFYLSNNGITFILCFIFFFFSIFFLSFFVCLFVHF
jgi:hypothetical protein